MTVSHPYVDKRTEHKRTPDYVVALSNGTQVQLVRFSCVEEAWRFYAEQTTRPGVEVAR